MFILTIFTLLSLWDTVQLADIEYMKNSIRNHFSNTRHHDPPYSDYKRAAKQFIYDEFVRLGLTTQYHNFTETSVSSTVTFQTVVGVLNGTRFGTSDDMIIGLGAHYDTVNTTKGVDDNGASVAAMLEVVKQITVTNRRGTSRKNTVLFAAFDLEEYGGCHSCSLSYVPLSGSRHFVQTWLPEWLIQNYGNHRPTVSHGVIVLDTIMNYNSSSHSQMFPPDVQSAFEGLFPNILANIASDNYKGDFITLIYRNPTNDSDLATVFKSSWASSGRSKYQLESFALPFSSINALSQNEMKLYVNFLRSDHANFWLNNFPAIWLTDTANFRGKMVDCYHHECDTVENMLTDDNINFLGKTTDAISKMIHTLSGPTGSVSRGSGTESLSGAFLVTILLLTRFVRE